MARLYKHGTELHRLTKDNFNYVFMSDGKILKGSSGRYKIVHLKPEITNDMLRARLIESGYELK